MVGDSGAGIVLIATGILLSRNDGSLDELSRDREKTISVA
jgi:hypothetical protein